MMTLTSSKLSYLKFAAPILVFFLVGKVFSLPYLRNLDLFWNSLVSTVVGVVVLFVLFKPNKPQGDFGRKFIIWFVIGFFLKEILSYAINLFPEPIDDRPPSSFNVSQIGFLFVLAAPIVEEFVFRYLPGKYLKDTTLSKFWYIAITSILFGVAHFYPGNNLYWNVMTVIPIALSGVLYSYIYVKTRNIFIPLLLHFTNNAIVIALIFV